MVTELLTNSEEPTVEERAIWDGFLALPPSQRMTAPITPRYPFPLLNTSKADRFYRNQLDQLSDREWFGIINPCNGKPQHVNTKSNPKPVLTTNGFRGRRSFGPKMAKQHLSATKENRQAAFHVSRSDAKVVLLGADFDVDENAMQPEHVDEMANLFDGKLGGRTFLEPSRNRRGRYCWMRVLREEPVQEFTRKLNWLNRRLRKILGTKHDHGGVGFDAIKGTIQYDDPNPLFDPLWARGFSPLLVKELDEHNFSPTPEFLKTNEKVYVWHKRHYRHGRFQYQEELERFVHHFGTLVTAPLCGVRNDGAEGEERWNAFWCWMLDDRYIIRSTDLWRIFGIDDDNADENDAEAAEINSQPPTGRPLEDADINPQNIISHPYGLAWKMLINKEDKLQSSNGAAATAFAMMGGPQPIDRHEELRRLTHDLYVRYGAATGDPTPERFARLDEAINHFCKTWNSEKRAQPDLTLKQVRHRRQYWLSILSHTELKEFCAPQVMVDFQGRRFEIRRKLSITHELLAAAELACWRLLSRTGTIPVQSLHRELKKLKMSRDGKHYRAILTLFSRRGIFRCAKASFRFDVPDACNDWNQSQGEARQWEPEHGALIPRPFQAHFPHIIDRRGRARYSTTDQQQKAQPAPTVMIFPIPTPMQAAIWFLVTSRSLAWCDGLDRRRPLSPSELNVTHGAGHTYRDHERCVESGVTAWPEEEIWINR